MSDNMVGDKIKSGRWNRPVKKGINDGRYKRRIVELETENAALKKRVADLEARVAGVN